MSAHSATTSLCGREVPHLAMRSFRPTVPLCWCIAGLALVSCNPYSRPPCNADEYYVSYTATGITVPLVMCLPFMTPHGPCPTFGGHATPAPVLDDGQGHAVCALQCSSDEDCDYDGGASCDTVEGSAGHTVNVCLYGWKHFWTWHILPAGYTGAANKDFCDEHCEVGFVAYYCFDQRDEFSRYNPEEHIDGNVVEYLHVSVDTSPEGQFNFGQYLSCCPPGSKTSAHPASRRTSTPHPPLLPPPHAPPLSCP